MGVNAAAHARTDPLDPFRAPSFQASDSLSRIERDAPLTSLENGERLVRERLPTEHVPDRLRAALACGQARPATGLADHAPFVLTELLEDDIRSRARAHVRYSIVSRPPLAPERTIASQISAAR